MNSRIPRPFQTHKTRRTAFTLIELLTVVAIIGILSAILIPTVAKVRQSARSAQCKSNLRQIGIGLAAYMVDSKTGILPGMIGNDSRALYTWSQKPANIITVVIEGGYLPPVPKMFTSYPIGKATDRGIYMCPGLELTSQYIAGGNQSTFMTDVRSNRMKEENGQIVPDNPNATPLRISDIASPSMRAQVACSNPAAHANRPNILFLDGHVEVMSPEKVTLAWPKNAWAWNVLDKDYKKP